MLDGRFREISGRAIGIILDYSTRAQYRIEVRGLENFTSSASTLVVFNHRRDDDVPIIGNILFGRRGLLGRGPIPYFITREDLFRTGFLGEYLDRWPLVVRVPLSFLDLKPVLWALRAYPMRRIPELTLREVLEDVLKVFGDVPLPEVLKPKWIDRFEQLARPGKRPESVRDALSGRFHSVLSQGYGLTKLTLSAFRKLKPYQRTIIESQLQLFIDLLEQGKIVQMAPEGAASKDGRFARIRAGLHVLLNRPRTLVRVLPIGITYDFMSSGRQRVFVNIGREILDLQGLKPRETSARVADAILGQVTITASHLASQVLLASQSKGEGVLTRTELLSGVENEARRWSEAGVHVDPRLLTHAELSRRMDEYIGYCLKSGTLIACGEDRYSIPEPAEKPRIHWTNPKGAASYVANELTSLSCLIST